MTLQDLFEVWTPLTVIAAIGPGLLGGAFLIGRFAKDPAYASGEATPFQYAVLTFALVAAVGLIFYALQILTSYVGGDTAWTRVVSRFGLWGMYSAALGVGTWLRLANHIARRHAEVHERAIAEVEAER